MSRNLEMMRFVSQSCNVPLLTHVQSQVNRHNERDLHRVAQEALAFRRLRRSSSHPRLPSKLETTDHGNRQALTIQAFVPAGERNIGFASSEFSAPCCMVRRKPPRLAVEVATHRSEATRGPSSNALHACLRSYLRATMANGYAALFIRCFVLETCLGANLFLLIRKRLAIRSLSSCTLPTIERLHRLVGCIPRR